MAECQPSALQVLDGTQSMQELRELVRQHPAVFKGVKTGGAGRTKSCIVAEMNQRIMIHELRREVKTTRAQLDGLRDCVENIKDDQRTTALSLVSTNKGLNLAEINIHKIRRIMHY